MVIYKYYINGKYNASALSLLKKRIFLMPVVGKLTFPLSFIHRYLRAEGWICLSKEPVRPVISDTGLLLLPSLST